MTPAQRIHELIMCPLQKCYPAHPPKRHRLKPQSLSNLVWTNRMRTREYLRGQLPSS